MFRRNVFKVLFFMGFWLFLNVSNIWAAVGSSSGAQDVVTATNSLADKMLEIFKGPLVKILAGVVLFVGVGGLLRGRHQVAVSCGIAFVLLLFLPIILQYFGG